MKYFYSSLSLLAVAPITFVLGVLQHNHEFSPKQSNETLVLSATPEQSEELISSSKPEAEATYSEIKKDLKTGDVILFQEYDLSGMEIILLETGVEKVPDYTHVGIVFRLPANNGLPAGLYLWQAIPPKGVLDVNYGADYFKGVVSDGAQMVSLDTVMKCLNNLTGSGIMYASLRPLEKPLNPDEITNLQNYARQVVGRSFSYPIPMNMIEDYFMGVREKKQSADYTFFCSKLASQTFLEAGLIDEVITNSVLPGHFALSPGDNKNLISFKENSFNGIVRFLPY